MDAMKWWKEKLDKALQPRIRKPREPSIYGSFNERLMASAIDISILFMLLNRPARVMSDNIYSYLPAEGAQLLASAQTIGEMVHYAVESGFASLYIINFSLQLLMVGVLYVTFQSWVQTTPGKWIMGLKITTADNETFPSLWRLILRYVGIIISCAPFMLGLVAMNLDSQRRAWHDRIAGTRVITTRPEGWYWAQCKKLFARFKDKG